MADYYTHFHHKIKNLTVEERAWIADNVKHDFVDEGVLARSMPVFLRDYTGMDSEIVEEGFNYNLAIRQIQVAVTEFWMEDTNGNCNLEKVAHFLQKFLKQFPHREYFVIAFAQTSNTPAEDAYGGGGFTVTQDTVRWMFSNDWLVAQTTKLEEQFEVEANILPK